MSVAALAAASFVPAFAQGQTAQLADGRILTIKLPLEPYANEGPIWDLDVVNKSLTAVGSKNTLPLSIDGAPFALSGTGFSDGSGHIIGEIPTLELDRLLDSNAASRDANTAFQGPARSLFSTQENRRTDAFALPTRSPAAQALVEANYFNYLQSAYAAHAHMLPADFLARAGMHSQDPASWVYPTTSGGTFKSAGHVYLDSEGRPYQIPDIEAVIELAENVRTGVVSSIHPGGNGVLPSFVIGEMLVIFNQDPRFPAHTLGLVEQDLPREIFMQQGLGRFVDVVGHAVGEHVLFAQEVFTDLVDPTAPLVVTSTNWLFRNQQNEIRFRGVVDRPQGVRLVVRINNSVFTNIPIAVDPVTGTGTYDFRTKNQLNVSQVTQVTVQAEYLNAPPGTPLAFDRTYLRSEVLGL